MGLKSFFHETWGYHRFTRFHEKLLSEEPLFPVGFRANWARRKNQLYVKREKLWVLLFSRKAKKILLHSPLQKNSLPLPTAEAVRLCDDKYEFNRALIDAGFGRYIPEMAEGRALTPPYILKKRIGIWGKDCFIISNPVDEQRQLDRITDPEYFCQKFIAGPTEFCTHILFVNGRIVKALNIKYEFASSAPIKGQDAPHLMVICRCPYLDSFARVLRTVRFEWLCCVNYKVVKGQPFLLEINPRFGGSLVPYFFSFVRHLR
ncbi:MAG: hypothetical protein ABSE96_10145 [Terracidiphilus sp.]